MLSHRLIILMPNEVVQKLQEEAGKLGMGYTTLARKILIETLKRDYGYSYEPKHAEGERRQT